MAAMALRALLWDVDGTLAETERDGHRRAFNRAFAEAGLPIHWTASGYGRWLSISGGRERMAAQLQELEGSPATAERLQALQTSKQRHYRSLVEAGELRLRPGVAGLLEQAHSAGLTQAIVTTSARSAVSALMEHLLGPLAGVFDFWICGDDVASKKPDPEAYIRAAALLNDRGLAEQPHEVLVLEDSRHGLSAARGAGLPCLLTMSHYGRREWQHQLPGPEAMAVVSDLGPSGAVLQGPACQSGGITLSYLQTLLG